MQVNLARALVFRCLLVFTLLLAMKPVQPLSVQPPLPRSHVKQGDMPRQPEVQSVFLVHQVFILLQQDRRRAWKLNLGLEQGKK